MVGTITDKQRSPHWHESGHRCGSHDSTFAFIRTRGIKFSGGYVEHTCGWTAAEGAAGDAATVTRHVVERRGVIMVFARSGAPLQVGGCETVSAPPNPVRNLLAPVVARAQLSSAAAESSHHQTGERVVNSAPGNVVPLEVVQSENRRRSHMLLWKSMKNVSFQRDKERGRPATHCWPSPGSPE